MGFVDTLQLKNNLPRRVVEIALLFIAVIYYVSLAVMHHISPLTGMLSILILLFTALLILALVGIHLIPRVNWLLVVAMIALPIGPFSVVMHNFLEGLAHRTEDNFILHQLLQFSHSAFFITAVFICIPLILIGLVGGGVVWYLGYRSVKQSLPSV